jgi:hypothetical protein
MMPRRRHPWHTRSIAALALMCTGCFEYAYLPLAQAPVGAMVRLQLSEAGRTHLAAELSSGPSVVGRTIEGTLLQADEQRLVIAVRLGSGGVGEATEIEQHVVIPAADILQVEHKQLDRTKSGMAAAAVGVGFVVFVARALNGTFGGTTTTPQ